MNIFNVSPNAVRYSMCTGFSARASLRFRPCLTSNTVENFVVIIKAVGLWVGRSFQPVSPLLWIFQKAKVLLDAVLLLVVLQEFIGRPVLDFLLSGQIGEKNKAAGFKAQRFNRLIVLIDVNES